jgi:hypothetical protein
MGNTRKLVILASALIGLLPRAAQGQGYLGGFGGYSYGAAAGECRSIWSDCADRRTGYGVTFGKMSGVFGFDQEYAWTSDFFGEDSGLEGSKVTTLMSSILVGVPAGPVRIYGALGIGLIKTKIEFSQANLEDYSDTAFGWNYGAGLLLLLPAHLGVKFDFRRFRSSAEIPLVRADLRDVHLEYSRVTIGVVLH